MRLQSQINILPLILDLRRAWASNESCLRDQGHAKYPRSPNQLSCPILQALRTRPSCLISLPPIHLRVLEYLNLGAQNKMVDFKEEIIGRQSKEEARTLTFSAVHVRGRARRHPGTRNAKLASRKSLNTRKIFRPDMSMIRALGHR
jgi:hypothetical protein